MSQTKVRTGDLSRASQPTDHALATVTVTLATLVITTAAAAVMTAVIVVSVRPPATVSKAGGVADEWHHVNAW